VEEGVWGGEGGPNEEKACSQNKKIMATTVD